jgi:hypothetical protein
MATAPARAQAPPASAPAVDVEADPIRCWWRTSAGAVRVGEPFSLVLTCAVVENETTTVVPDQTRLEPAAMQLPPFEVVSGQRGPDLRRGQRRFFQYEYVLRLINDTSFGADVAIPNVQISYHVDSRVGGGETARGREQKYDLPTESVRVLSLVPADATDIRDPAYPTFAAIDSQRFRARGWFVAGGVLYAAAALLVLAAIVRAFRRYRGAAQVQGAHLSAGEILAGVDRELAAVAREVAREGWTRQLAGRTAAATRVAASIALERTVGQIQAGSADDEGHEGQLPLRGGWLWGKKVFVSGSATADALDRRLSTGRGGAAHRLALEQLKNALARFTAAQFGREQAPDESAFSEALADARRGLARIRGENRWLVRKFRSMSHAAAGLGNRAWSR